MHISLSNLDFRKSNIHITTIMEMVASPEFELGLLSDST
jgi:hypothetical protein